MTNSPLYFFALCHPDFFRDLTYILLTCMMHLYDGMLKKISMTNANCKRLKIRNLQICHLE